MGRCLYRIEGIDPYLNKIRDDVSDGLVAMHQDVPIRMLFDKGEDLFVPTARERYLLRP
jgi:uncharacterized protein YktB (UPF0637 family)